MIYYIQSLFYQKLYNNMLQKIVQLNAEEKLWSVDWHPSGKILATVGQSRSIKLWSVNNDNKWSLVETLETSHTKSIRCVKFNHSGQSLAVASFDSHISIFIKGENGYEELQVLEGPQNEVKCVDWSPDDKYLASCSRDKMVWIWSFNSNAYEYECDFALQGHTEDIKSVLWIDNSTVVSTSYDNSIRIWSRNDDEFEQQQVLTGHQSIVWSVAYDSKEKVLYSVGEDKKIIRWVRNPKNDKFQYSYLIEQIHAFPIYTCCLLDSNLLVTGSGDNTLALVKFNNESELLLQRKYHQGDVNCVKSWHGERTYLASVSDDEKLVLWKLKQE